MIDPVEASLSAYLREQDEQEAAGEALDSRAWAEALKVAGQPGSKLEVREGDELRWIDCITVRVPCWLHVVVDPLERRHAAE
jgi:hypothetical protein